jgi:hypothetical protein
VGRDGGGEFALPEVIALVNERYVALNSGRKSRCLRSPNFWPRPAFGTALLVCTPDGRVVLDRFGPAWEVLVEGLTAIPELPGPEGRTSRPLAQARALLHRGDLAGPSHWRRRSGPAAAWRLIATAMPSSRATARRGSRRSSRRRRRRAPTRSRATRYDEIDFLIKVARLDDAKSAAVAFTKAYPSVRVAQR